MNLLPDKESLANAEARKKFFEENKLFTVEQGIPFLAGLLDGDGSFGPYVKKSPFERLDPWRWEFAQSKSRMTFLVDYIKTFARSLAPDSVTVRMMRRRGGVVLGRKLPTDDLVNIRIRKSGIVSLLKAGIVRYSWKAERWSMAVANFRSERLTYYTTGEIARMLGVCLSTVGRWLDTGKMTYIRRKGSGNPNGLSFRYIPIHEFQRFGVNFLKKKDMMNKAESESVKLVDAARMLDVSGSTLYRLR
jgi:excisionase family DNA binding protein